MENTVEIHLGSMPDPDSVCVSITPPRQSVRRDAFELLEVMIREQHPDWVCGDGSCPMCVAYEYELVEEFAGRTSHESIG